jgi:uncharacterized membrane protein
MQRKLLGISFIAGLLIFTILDSCVHDPFVTGDGGSNNNNGNNNNNTSMIDTTGVKCDSTKVYYDNEVAPIFRKSCAISGCHGDGSYREGVDMTSYARVLQTAGVVAGKPSNSELFKIITTTKNNDVMPPPPYSRLTPGEIAIINAWITQGAKNLSCNPNWGKVKSCDSLNVKYSTHISKIMAANCTSCHSTINAQGGIKLDNHANVAAAGKNGSLFGTINHSPGYDKMPQGSPKLDKCTITQVKKWIDNGVKND